MIKFNQEILAAIYKICEREGAIKKVGPRYYNSFLKMSPKGLEALIFFILKDRVNDVNKKIFSNKWKNDKEIYNYIMDFLYMIAQGIMGLRETDGRLVFSKPVGPSQ